MSQYRGAKHPFRAFWIHRPSYTGWVAAVWSMTFLNSVAGGFGVAAAVVTVLAISDGLSTWIFDGQTISSKVAGRIGGAGGV